MNRLFFSGSLRNKLILLMLLAAVLPFGASLFISQQFTEERLADKAVKDNSNLLIQGKANLINYLQTFQLTSNSIYNNEPLMEILNNRSKDYFSEMEIYSTEQTVRSALHNIELSFPDVEQVYLYAKQASRSYLYNTRMIANDKHGFPYRPPSTSEQQSEVLPPRLIETYGKSFIQTSKPTVITYQHSLIDLFPGTELGVLSVDLRMETINRISAQLYAEGEEELYIVDSAGTMVYAPDSALYGQQPQLLWIEKLQQELALGERNSFRLNDSDYEGVFIFEPLQLPYLDWVLVKHIPDAVLFQSERELLRLNLITGLFFLIVAMTVTVFVSIKMTAPIIQLIGYINKIKLGHMNVDIRMNRNDELGTLALRFKAMMHTINELVLKEYRLEVANKTNELKALQAQVNPHFLNNALQSIGALALQHQNKEVYSLISLLGKMMRYSMNTEEPLVMLKSEMDYIKSYLRLQKQRFRSQFTEHLEYEPETELIQIPKMIIQPLVENYFKHGFMGGDLHNSISVHCHMDKTTGFLHIEITDNGFGVSADMLHELRRRLNQTGNGQQLSEAGSIGLVNVMLRLQLYYQGRAQMTIDRAEPQGFKVILQIPPTLTEGAMPNESSHH